MPAAQHTCCATKYMCFKAFDVNLQQDDVIEAVLVQQIVEPYRSSPNQDAAASAFRPMPVGPPMATAAL